MAKSIAEIAELLKHTKFRLKFLFGVDERDVWKKLDRLRKEYETLIEAERERYQALIDERERMLKKQNETLQKYRKMLEQNSSADAISAAAEQDTEKKMAILKSISHENCNKEPNTTLHNEEE